MAVDRTTCYDTLTDDSGTGTDGTVWDKAKVGALLDAIDTALGSGVGAPVVQTTTATGTQNDFSLSSSFTYLRCTGAAPVFNGFSVATATPSDGDRVIIDCLGTTAKVANQAGASTAAYRVITPSTAGQIVGVNGRMECVYDGTTGRWRESVVSPGAPTAITFDAGHFTGNGSMTWTVESGDVRVLAFSQRGRLVDVLFGVVGTSVGGTPSTLLTYALATATGFTVSFVVDATGLVADNGTYQAGRATFNTTGVLSFSLLSGSNWQAATNLTNCFINQTIEVD